MSEGRVRFDRSKAVVPVSLLLCGLFYEAICFMFTLCYFVLVFFCPFSIYLAWGRFVFLVLFVRLFDLRLFGFVCFPLVSGTQTASM